MNGSRGRTAHWMLEESEAPYRYEAVNLEMGDQKQPAFLAVNPMGEVPAIVHRGTVITESGAICAHLADAFPAAGLAPPSRITPPKCRSGQLTSAFCRRTTRSSRG